MEVSVAKSGPKYYKIHSLLGAAWIFIGSIGPEQYAKKYRRTTAVLPNFYPIWHEGEIRDLRSEYSPHSI